MDLSGNREGQTLSSETCNNDSTALEKVSIVCVPRARGPAADNSAVMTAQCDLCKVRPCVPCPALFPNAEWTVSCPLMGADKYAASRDIDAATALTLVRRPHNGRDGNAISVNVSSNAASTDTDTIICGYLPAHFTSALAPLIDAHYVTRHSNRGDGLCGRRRRRTERRCG